MYCANDSRRVSKYSPWRHLRDDCEHKWEYKDTEKEKIINTLFIRTGWPRREIDKYGQSSWNGTIRCHGKPMRLTRVITKFYKECSVCGELVPLDKWAKYYAWCDVCGGRFRIPNNLYDASELSLW